MWFLAIFLAIAGAIYLQLYIYKRFGFSHLKYSVEFDAKEVFCGDHVYLYERIRNEGILPLPFAKIDTELPEGLELMLIENISGNRSVKKVGRVESIFTLKGKTQIERRWRVVCTKRGNYSIDGSIMVISDMLGMSLMSKKITLEKGEKNGITVLPSPADIDRHYTSSMYISGNVIKNRCLTSDPLSFCGIREYSVYDPMSKINWKLSAKNAKLMVNIEEKVVRHSFSLILNMNSYLIERYSESLIDEAAVERAISVCASLLDGACENDIPTRFFANTQMDDDLLALGAIPTDTGGNHASLSTDKICGKGDLLYALRILSAIKPNISVSIEEMLDHIAGNIGAYRENENFIIITPYIDSRMLRYHSDMRKLGIDVIFYVTSGRKDISGYPENVEIYYKTY